MLELTLHLRIQIAVISSMVCRRPESEFFMNTTAPSYLHNLARLRDYTMQQRYTHLALRRACWALTGVINPLQDTCPASMASSGEKSVQLFFYDLSHLVLNT